MGKLEAQAVCVKLHDLEKLGKIREDGTECAFNSVRFQNVRKRQIQTQREILV